MEATLNKSQKSGRGIKIFILIIVLGVIVFLCIRFRFYIMGLFSQKSKTNGPDATQTNAIIQSENNTTQSNILGGGTQKPYWPLKRGSKNESVRWLQVMLNLIPNTGGKVLEDGSWGAKTEAKVNAAKTILGLSSNEVTHIEYLKLFCYTYPNSEACKKIKEQYPNL